MVGGKEPIEKVGNCCILLEIVERFMVWLLFVSSKSFVLLLADGECRDEFVVVDEVIWLDWREMPLFLLLVLLLSAIEDFL